MTKKFTDLQLKFIEIYVRMRLNPEKKPNATKAAFDAGYSESSAYQRGYELVSNSDIWTEIERRVSISNATMDNAAIASQREVLEFLTRAMRFRQTDNWNRDGTMKDMEEIEPHSDLIDSIKVTVKPDGTEKREIRTVPKKEAAQLLGNYHGMWKDTVEHTGAQITIMPQRMRKGKEAKRSK